MNFDNEKSFRRICFTYFLEPDEVFSIPDSDSYRRFVYQEEITPTTLQHHIQGYVEFTNPLKWRTIKALFHVSTHFEPARGTAAQNFAYCTKADSRAPNGQQRIWPDDDAFTSNQGKRSDLIEAADIIKQSSSLKRVADELPSTFIKYHKGLTAYHEIIHSAPRSTSWEEVDFRWYFGASGSGKTNSVYEEFREQGIYSKGNDNKWFDSYDPTLHKVILIDDYRNHKELPYQRLLTLCDVYPSRVESKGTSREIDAKIIIITSNFPPWGIWGDVESDPLQQLDTESITPMVRRCAIWNFSTHRNPDDNTKNYVKNRLYKHTYD